MKARWVFVALALLALAAPTTALGCGTTLSLAHGGGGTALESVIHDMASSLEEDSDSRLCLDVYRDVYLGLTDATQDLQMGTIDLAAVRWEYILRDAPAVMLLDSPFAFETYREVTDYWNEHLAEVVARDAADRGFKVLGLWHLGFSDIAANAPLDLPAALEGLSMQGMAPGPFRDAYAAYGTIVDDNSGHSGAPDAVEIELYKPESARDLIRHWGMTVTLTRHRYHGLVVLGGTRTDHLDFELSPILLDFVTKTGLASEEAARVRDEKVLNDLRYDDVLNELDPHERQHWVRRFGFCPDCGGSGQTCSRYGCPCGEGNCTTNGDEYCCTPSSMPPEYVDMAR